MPNFINKPSLIKWLCAAKQLSFVFSFSLSLSWLRAHTLLLMPPRYGCMHGWSVPRFDRHSFIVVNALSRSHASLTPLHSHLLSLRTWGQADRHDIFFSSFQYRLDCPQWKKVRVIRTDIINSENKITWIHPKTSLPTDMVHYQTHFVQIGRMDSSTSHLMWTYIYPMRCVAWYTYMHEYLYKKNPPLVSLGRLGIWSTLLLLLSIHQTLSMQKLNI